MYSSTKRLLINFIFIKIVYLGLCVKNIDNNNLIDNISCYS
ncbi:hypothetical protein SAMN05660866_02332 [Maribacter arcticus]|uniref:Uncharacterized protein n=1 Tax=Maribacter arcticus TaxID=561365 RepID=A0A1T5CJ07_9FLAO|nr:hypothetical protein SAMN05660866_02332 [Maribacter arcticus]